MSKLNSRRGMRLLAAGALMAFASMAQAQYMWIDEKGLKQFSDRAPPPSIPLKNILKAPSGAPTAASPPPDQPAAAAAPEAAKPKAPPTLADRNADFLKRAKEKAEREQKDKEAEETKAAKIADCERAQGARRTLDTVARISTQDKNGERSFMSDEQRAVEIKRIDKVLADCK